MNHIIRYFGERNVHLPCINQSQFGFNMGIFVMGLFLTSYGLWCPYLPKRHHKGITRQHVDMYFFQNYPQMMS